MSPVPGLSRVGLLGGGVIGGGWAARFALNGVDVTLFDPDPQAARKVGEVMANARRALHHLVHTELPAEGAVTIVTTPEDAVAGADFVQESAPEQLQLKQDLLARASAAAPPDVVFGSSTSGLLPTELQQRMTHPERLVVGHPFNPVYLLPLVEVCGGTLTAAASIERASAVYGALGMKPLVLAKEIDGFVADRLLEALWREALWLVNDGIATTAEIDDAIRYGAGLRWSFMGTFLTYRIAGGEAGMRHFMAQFGPALQWPWTKLMDVPELTDELVDRVVEQSDAQAGGRSIRELEALRDDCLVRVMQGLRSVGFGAGEVLEDYDRLLYSRIPARATERVPGTPLRLHERTVPPDWVDYNGHTNDSRYLQLASEASDAFQRLIGVDAAYLAAGHSYYTAQSLVTYVAQTGLGDALYATGQLLAADAKRMHLFVRMHRAADDELVATAETMLLHVDTTTDTVVPASAEVAAALEAVRVDHASIPRPPQAGLRVGERAARPAAEAQP